MRMAPGRLRDRNNTIRERRTRERDLLFEAGMAVRVSQSPTHPQEARKAFVATGATSRHIGMSTGRRRKRALWVCKSAPEAHGPFACS